MAVAPLSNVESGFSGCPMKKCDLARLPKIEHDVIGRRQVSIADEKADQAHQRLWLEALPVEPKPLDAFPGPVCSGDVAVRSLENAICRQEVIARTLSANACRHFGGKHTMIRSDHQIEAHPLEADHVTAILLANEPQGGLIFKAPVNRARREKFLPRYRRPRLPAVLGKNVRGVVVTAVPVPHEETDQAFVGLVHLFLAAGEADTRGIHDREVGRHRAVEPDEAVIEDADRVLRYHSVRGGHR